MEAGLELDLQGTEKSFYGFSRCSLSFLKDGSSDLFFTLFQMNSKKISVKSVLSPEVSESPV